MVKEKEHGKDAAGNGVESGGQKQAEEDNEVLYVNEVKLTKCDTDEQSDTLGDVFNKGDTDAVADTLDHDVDKEGNKSVGSEQDKLTVDIAYIDDEEMLIYENIRTGKPLTEKVRVEDLKDHIDRMTDSSDAFHEEFKVGWKMQMSYTCCMHKIKPS